MTRNVQISAVDDITWCRLKTPPEIDVVLRTLGKIETFKRTPLSDQLPEMIKIEISKIKEAITYSPKQMKELRITPQEINQTLKGFRRLCLFLARMHRDASKLLKTETVHPDELHFIGKEIFLRNGRDESLKAFGGPGMLSKQFPLPQEADTDTEDA